ncbi:MAG: LEPR-XLL domain-containing protein, partial [Sedimentisphaerales bacterium]|nr:LEPR-XLL domain-containing protein [Sedimentisphaerales bacterium]
MSYLRKLRRQHRQVGKGHFTLESLEPRLLLAADLQVSSLGMDGLGPFDWAGTLDLNVEILNAGDAVATGDATVKFYLSDDATLEVGTDTLLAETLTVTDLADGTQVTEAPTVTLPASGTDGDKYLFMLVDSEGAIAESDENNNSASLWIAVGASTPATGIDLAAGEPDLPDAIELIWGHSYVLCADAFNLGDTDAGAFTIDVVLSDDPLFDATDTSLLGSPLEVTGGLTAQNEAIHDVEVTLPATGFSDGEYFVLVVADSTGYDVGGQVAETYESDNVAGQAVQIVTTPTLASGIDLLGLELDLDLDAEPFELVWSQQSLAEVGLYNTGDAPAGPFVVSLALSTDQTYSVLSGDDIVVGAVQIASLDSTGLIYPEIPIQMPQPGVLSDGSYYLVALIDSGQ